MHAERFDFQSARGERLAARFELPEGREPRAFALFAHCFARGKDSHAASRIAAALAKLGIATLRLDFTGLGGSDGEFANTGFSSNVDDLVAAAAAMREAGRAPSLLVGHSLGGAAVLAAAERIPEVAAVAVIGAPLQVDHVVHQFAERVPAIEAEGEALVNLAGRSFTIRKAFLDDARMQDQERRVARLGRALLVMHSPVDAVVGVDNARAIFDRARHPKSFVSLDDADHLLSRRSDSNYAASVLAAWAERYLPAARPDGPAEAVLPEEGSVVVAETRRGRFDQVVTVGPHRLVADEPRSVGGLDSGPSPYDLLLAGLGACTSMTLRLYAEHKKLPLERVRVALRHRKIHARDCAECATREGKLDDIEREIELVGPLSEGERARLLEIADRCPVHRTLHDGEVRIKTSSP